MKLEKSPVLIERLKSFVTDGAILGATDFKTLAVILSGPVDFVASSVSRRWHTSSTLLYIETPLGTQLTCKKNIDQQKREVGSNN